MLVRMPDIIFDLKISTKRGARRESRIPAPHFFLKKHVKVV